MKSEPATYAYSRPGLTVDITLFALASEGLQVLLVRRDLPPFEGEWALPGGFVRTGESLETAARRELDEETGLTGFYLEQLYTFGAPDRDPREHIVTVAYYALVSLPEQKPTAGTDADCARWFSCRELPGLAFDHLEILNTALSRIQGKLRYQPIGFELLPEKFTLSQLQGVYEAILERPLDKRNFRKKIQSLDVLTPLKEYQENVSHRAARLYRFDRKKHERLTRKGILFEV